MSHPSLLAQAVDIHQWLELDQATPIAERLERDRNIGLQQEPMDDIGRVLQWWGQIKAPCSSTGLRVVTIRRWLVIGLFVAGVAAGMGLCSLALGYEGDYPVNLLALLGVLVGIPGLLLLLTVLSSVLRSPLQKFGLKPLGEIANTFNINRWTLGLWDRLCGVRFSATGSFAYWQLLMFSQWLASGFFVGVLCMYGLLVAVTDLAFGWSTTLQMQAATVHQWTAFIACPWASWWSAAVPSLDLVEASRFYRLAGAVGGGRAAHLGDWWPFVLMAILFWGLIPRLAMMAWGAWRLAAASRALLREHHQVTALLDRLTMPAADYASDAAVDDIEQLASLPEPGQIELAGAAVIVWNEACEIDTIGGQIGDVIALGTLDNQQQRLRALRRVAPGVRKLVLFTKAWEPPVLEYNDLLTFIRTQLGGEPSIVVALVGVAGGPVTESDFAIWSRAVAKIGDSRVYVVDDIQARA